MVVKGLDGQLVAAGREVNLLMTKSQDLASDYSYFYNNIKENVSKRVEAYKTNQK